MLPTGAKVRRWDTQNCKYYEISEYKRPRKGASLARVLLNFQDLWAVLWLINFFKKIGGICSRVSRVMGRSPDIFSTESIRRIWKILEVQNCYLPSVLPCRVWWNSDFGPGVCANAFAIRAFKCANGLTPVDREGL